MEICQDQIVQITKETELNPKYPSHLPTSIPNLILNND